MGWITDVKEDEAIVREIDSSSDRAAAIVACALIEDRLRARLKASLREGNIAERVVNSFAGSLANMNALAYAMRIYEKDLFHNIEIVGKVRNKFAHRAPVNSFNVPAIRDLCGQLKSNLPSLMVTFLKPGEQLPVPEPRDHFIHVVQRILMDLAWAGPGAAPKHMFVHRGASPPLTNVTVVQYSKEKGEEPS
jgi:hypothetical protein